MKTSDFNIKIPKNLIAQKPNKYRDQSKLMIINKKNGIIKHKKFKDIINYFNEGDLIIMNNSKVFPSKLSGRKEKTEAKIDVYLLREIDKKNKIWDTLVDPARKVRVGNKIYFNCNKLNYKDILIAEIIDNTTSRGRIIRFLFNGSNKDLYKIIKSIGKSHLPKYIKRKPEKEDEIRYQTVYAKKEGSIVAPYAGMHFTKNLILKLKLKNIKIAYITLHSGLNIFSTVKVEDISKNKIYSEKCIINKKACNLINNAIKNNKKICAVGYSTMKAIESSISSNNKLNIYKGWTNKFIFPPYKFNIANSMITNFHMPKSTLLMLLSAFLGYNLMIKSYKIAIKKKYKFYIYGDSMLII